MKTPRLSSLVPSRIKRKIREKAISRTETRLLIAGRRPEDFSEEELEIIVREEEEKLEGQLREKGLLALAAVLGIGWWL